MEKICPRCGKKYTEVPAISRKDNKTEICPDCGFVESIFAIKRGIEGNVLHNSNGKDYCIVLGRLGKPAFLVRLNDEPRKYIVCDELEPTAWFHGEYYDDFEEALKAYRSKV